MHFDRVLSFLTSVRLTVFCLACALVLVFAGTLAQVHLGLYQTQERYFHSIFVFWTPSGTNWKIPVWPGGYLLGAILLVNLLGAHGKRFSFSRKRIGLAMIHGGLVLLLLGQFFTETLQVETFMRLEEGETKNYTESARQSELALIDVSQPDQDQVVTVPLSRLAEGGELAHPSLPFTVRVKEYFPNSTPASRAGSAGAQMISASQGVGQRLFFQRLESTLRMDDENVPAALIEVVTPSGSLGTWTVSNWLTKHAGSLRRNLSPQAAGLLDVPQQFTFDNRTYQIALRPVRYYKPYSITLLDFTHKRYKGTEIPKDFSSRIRLQHAQKNEDREVLIYMNNPLRYAGETYYQGGFEPGDTVSILQVVRNPAWLTPYLSCTLISVGLTVHFLMHLMSFSKTHRGNLAVPVPPQPRKRRRDETLVPSPAALNAMPTHANSMHSAAPRRNS